MVNLNTEYVCGCPADAGLVYHKDDLVTNMIKEILVFSFTTSSFKQNLNVRSKGSLLLLTNAVCQFLSAFDVLASIVSLYTGLQSRGGVAYGVTSLQANRNTVNKASRRGVATSTTRWRHIMDTTTALLRKYF
jgi:lysylphosphatidylglycerol synthetase-like protein (DUF2156 family)